MVQDAFTLGPLSKLSNYIVIAVASIHAFGSVIKMLGGMISEEGVTEREKKMLAHPVLEIAVTAAMMWRMAPVQASKEEIGQRVPEIHLSKGKVD